jgi:outer membrane biosynthesis protein TonB
VRPAKKPRRRVARAYPEIVDSFGPAFVLTVLIHLLLFKGASSSGLFVSAPAKIEIVPTGNPVSVTTAPKNTPIPANLLPPQMRPTPPKFVEVNPLAPSQKPDHDRNTGAADQRAAQPTPDPTAKGDRPRVKGEEPDSTRIVQAIPRDFIPPDIRPPAGSPLGMPVPEKPSPDKTAKPTKSSEGPSARADLPKGKPITDKGTAFVEKPGPEKPAKADKADQKTDDPSEEKHDGEKSAEKTPDTKSVKPEKTEIARATSVSENPSQSTGKDTPAKPRPRATIAGTSGPLGVSLSGASAAGTLALDSRFSRMGEYASRMYEIIQAAWWVGADRSRINESGTVVIEFTLNKDGSVSGAKIVEKTTSDRAAYLCLDAVTGRAPFDPWPDDMIGMFGDKQEGRLTFHYR